MKTITLTDVQTVALAATLDRIPIDTISQALRNDKAWTDFTDARLILRKAADEVMHEARADRRG